MSEKNDEKFHEAEAQRRFEEALKGASKAPAKKKAKPPAPKRKRPAD